MNWLNKILNVRSNEWSRLLFIAVILIFSNVGTTWAMNTAYAAFVKEVGAQSVIWVQLLSSILSILFMFVYTAFVDRVDNNRLFAYIIAIGVVIKLISITLAGVISPAWAFLGLYVLSMVWLAAWGAQFATYVNDLFDIQSAKRTWPIILAAASIGGITGGFTLQFLTTRLSPLSIIWIWVLTDVVAFGVVWVMPIFIKGHKKFSKTGVKSGKPFAQNEETSYLQGMKDGLGFTLQSGLLRWMAIGTLILMALMSLLEYYYNLILAPQFDDYAGFLGKLEGVSSIISLLILFFGIGWMTRSWGVKDTNLVYPTLNLLICGGVAGFPTALTASLAFITRKGLRSGFQETIDALLFNAVPLRIKGRARAFVGGMITPLGTLTGVFLLWVLGETIGLLRGAIALLALIYLVSAFVTRHQYTQALVKMLEEEDYSFLLSEGASNLSVADPATLSRLQKKLEESASHEMRIFMTQLIAQVGGAESLSILIPAIKAAPEPRTRASMLDVVSAAGLRGGKIRELYVDFLTDPDAQVRQAAASGLEQLLGAKDPWLQEQWLNMVGDSDSHISLYALQSLAGTGGFYKFEPATQKLDQLLQGDSIEDKRNAIDVLGMIAHPKSIERLLFFLEDVNDQIRLAAILDLEKLALPLGSALDTKILEKTQSLLHDPVARVRQAALQVIGKFKDKKVYPLLVSALADKNSQVCSTAVNILVAIGRDIAPMAQAELNSTNSQIHKMAAVVLSRINPRQFGSLIDKSVSNNLNNIYQNISLEQALTPYNKYYSVRVQLAALREGNDNLIDEILYLLSAIHDPQILNVIGESLHSDSPETRNLALEALESLTSPQTAALIASLFEPSMAPMQLLELGHGTLNVEQVNIVQALEKLFSSTNSRLFNLLALHVVGDIGADLPKTPNQQGDINRLLEALETPSGKVDIDPALPMEVRSLLEKALNNSDLLIQQAAQAALQKISGSRLGDVEDVVLKDREESKEISVIERISILKEVPFFRDIPISQLENLAMMCKEKKYRKGTRIFKTGDLGETLYIVVEGQVGIEQEKRGGATLLATLGNNSYFGEMSLFDKSPRSTSAVVLKDSFIMEVNRAPIFALTMQNPDLALELINVLSQRIRETSDRLADTARSRPRELHKLFDQFG